LTNADNNSIIILLEAKEKGKAYANSHIHLDMAGVACYNDRTDWSDDHLQIIRDRINMNNKQLQRISEGMGLGGLVTTEVAILAATIHQLPRQHGLWEIIEKAENNEPLHGLWKIIEKAEGEMPS